LIDVKLWLIYKNYYVQSCELFAAKGRSDEPGNKRRIMGAASASESCIEYLKTVDTPTLSNAIELLKLRPRSDGFTPLSVRCLSPELGRMVGYAVTAQVETMSEGPLDWSLFLQLFEAVAQSPKPAVVTFQEVGPHRNYAAHCGEVMATIFTRLGATGLVTDCAVRDIAEVRAINFRYFARGLVASHAYFRIVRVSIPVQVEGLIVRANDLLHGDENGLIVIPGEALTRLPDAVHEVRSHEGDLMQFVRGPEFTFDRLKGRILE
jgi:4-hydroxy-4-methyl-2-oxoglutarate aldolase